VLSSLFAGAAPAPTREGGHGWQSTRETLPRRSWRRLSRIGGGEIAADVDGWGERDLRTLVDALVAGLADDARCHLKSMRTDAASFAKLGIAADVPASGSYAGVPILMTDLEPETMVFVFAPR